MAAMYIILHIPRVLTVREANDTAPSGDAFSGEGLGSEAIVQL